MKNPATAPNFSALTKVEEKLLAARLDAVRLSISHAGEKGRALEFHVRSLLRALLPTEYGLTTGFVAWQSPNGIALSPQLDVIIYDAIRHSALIHLETCDVLPLEAVYGYVEVKATLRSTSDAATKLADDSLELCIRKNKAMREMRTRHYHVALGGSPIEYERVGVRWLAPRAYVVAFEPVGSIMKNADLLAVRMAEVLEHEGGAHIHGLLLPNLGFFYTRPVNAETALADDYFHVRYTTDHPLLAFKTILLQGLGTFQRPDPDWFPGLEGYFSVAAQWKEKTPRGSE